MRSDAAWCVARFHLAARETERVGRMSMRGTELGLAMVKRLVGGGVTG